MTSPALHLFHMAPLHQLASLQEKGLDPAFCREHPSKPRAVFLASDAPHARGYENHHGDWPDGGILLRVPQEALDAAQLAPDDVDLPELEEEWEGLAEDWEDLSAEQSLRISGQCRCLVAIPPDRIEASPDGGATWGPLAAVVLEDSPSPG